MSTTIQTWYNYVLQQMAAESYLDQEATTINGRIGVLEFGSNNPNVQQLQNYLPTEPILPGATRMTATQAADFLARYQVIDHRANDDSRFNTLGLQANGVNVLVGNGSGLSATLLYDTQTNQYTLSIRSTEYQNADKGGDWLRDGLPGADGEIGSNGFALGQIEALEEYYQTLIAQGSITATTPLNVTGYSLSGHLATVFSQLHPDVVAQTHVLNSPGEGSYDTTQGSMAEMLAYFQDALAANLQGQTSVVQNNLYITELNHETGAYVPLNPYYAAAVSATRQQFGLEGQSAWNALWGSTGGTANFGANFYQFYGIGAHNDSTHVANTGIHQPATPIFIEDQPDIQGWVLFGEHSDFGTTHSITLVADSLAVMSVFEKLGLNMDCWRAFKTDHLCALNFDQAFC